MTLAIGVVELAAISWVRWKYLDTRPCPPLIGLARSKYASPIHSFHKRTGVRSLPNLPFGGCFWILAALTFVFGVHGTADETPGSQTTPTSLGSGAVRRVRP
jgi:hypothetical protein